MKTKYLVAIGLIACLMPLLSIALYRRPPAFLKRFWAPASALNLAIFRIVLFAGTLIFSRQEDLAFFATLPRDLLFPPVGTNWIVPFLPGAPAFAQVAGALHWVVVFLAMIGWRTRLMAGLATVLGLYVFGVPQLYGKINHYHHLVWFAAILAASPCGDALSVDALLTAWKRKTLPLKPSFATSAAYSVPLCFIWLLMGAIYFWAGLWKAWTGRLDWIVGNNLRFTMYDKWLELGGWMPLFRIDQYPLLCEFMAAFTIVWELSFIVLILFASTRYAAVIGGLLFHNGTYLLMKIDFWTMQICYVSLIDWEAVCRAAGRRLFPRELRLLYDGQCSFCRKVIAAIQAIDVLRVIRYEDARGASRSEEELSDIIAVDGQITFAGFDAYRELVKRIPFLWFLMPLLYVPPAVWAGKKIYRYVADHRVCALAVPIHEPLPAGSWRGSAAVGFVLLYIFALSSVAKYHSWPFAGYPTFEDVTSKAEKTNIIMHARTSDNQPVRRNLETRPLLMRMRSERNAALLNQVLRVSDDAERLQKLRAYWCAGVSEQSSLSSLHSIQFTSAVISTLPERWAEPPLTETPIVSLTDASCSPRTSSVAAPF